MKKLQMTATLQNCLLLYFIAPHQTLITIISPPPQVPTCDHVLCGSLPPSLPSVCVALCLPAGPALVHSSFWSLTPHMPTTEDSLGTYCSCDLETQAM